MLRRLRNFWPAIVSLFLLAQAVAAQLPITGIGRVGYRVTDARKAQAFYSGVLGLPRVLDTPGRSALYQVNDRQYIKSLPD